MRIPVAPDSGTFGCSPWHLVASLHQHGISGLSEPRNFGGLRLAALHGRACFRDPLSDLREPIARNPRKAVPVPGASTVNVGWKPVRSRIMPAARTAVWIAVGITPATVFTRWRTPRGAVEHLERRFDEHQ